jgi:hypothetical protein
VQHAKTTAHLLVIRSTISTQCKHSLIRARPAGTIEVKRKPRPDQDRVIIVITDSKRGKDAVPDSIAKPEHSDHFS